MARRVKDAISTIVNIYLAARQLAVGGEAMAYAQSELEKLYPHDKIGEKSVEEQVKYVKGKINLARQALLNNFVEIDGKKVRVFKSEGHFYTDKAKKNLIPDTARKLVVDPIWERGSRASSLDALADLLSGVSFETEDME